MKKSLLSVVLTVLASRAALAQGAPVYAGELGAVTNRSGGTVSIFGTAGGGGSGALIADVPVAPNPWGIVSLPDIDGPLEGSRSEWWVTCPNSDQIFIIDKHNLSVVFVFNGNAFDATSPFDEPRGITRDAFGHVYVVGRANPGGPAAIYQFFAPTREVTAIWVLGGTTFPAVFTSWKPGAGAASGPGPGELYFTVPGDGLVGQFDLLTGTFNVVASGMPSPLGIDVSPGGDTTCFAKGGVTMPPVVKLIDSTSLPPALLGDVNLLFMASTEATRDVVFGMDIGSSHYAYVAVEDTALAIGTVRRVEVLAGVGTDQPPAQNVGYDPGAVSFKPPSPWDGFPRLYVGHQNPGESGLGVINTALWNPPSFVVGLPVNGSPYECAFLPPNPPPAIWCTAPAGGPVGGGNLFRIHGVNLFGMPGSLQAWMLPPSGPPVPALVEYALPDEVGIRVPAGVVNSGNYGVQIRTADQRFATLPRCYTYTVPAFDACNVPPGQEPWQYQIYSWGSIVYHQEFRDRVIAAFGPYDPSNYRMFAWNRFNPQGYVEFPDIPWTFDNDITGEGIWILSRQGGVLAMNGWDSVGMNNDPMQLCLAPGWNLIGNPYPGISFLDSALVDEDLNDAVNPIPLTNPANNKTTQFVFAWNPPSNGYVIVGSGGYMEVHRGYWIFNQLPQIVYLTLAQPPGMKAGEEPQQVSRAPGEGDPTPPPPPGSARSGGGGGGGGSCSASTSRSGDAGAAFSLLPVLLMLVAAGGALALHRRA